jgi:hypothetical protein
VAGLTYFILCKIWPAKAVPDQWTEDGDQNLVEGRIARTPSDDDYEAGNWKLNDGQDAGGFHDRKLTAPTDSPSGSNF